MADYSFNEIQRLDGEIYQLAYYEATKGQFLVVNEQADLLEIQKKVAKSFNNMKSMIRRGECSLEFIKENIIAKYGPIYRGNDKFNEVKINTNKYDKSNKEVNDFLNDIGLG